MRRSKLQKRLFWIVVYVWRGFPESVRIFETETSAQKYADCISKTINKDYDEVGIFEVRI
jgi:hypothetical protein